MMDYNGLEFLQPGILGLSTQSWRVLIIAVMARLFKSFSFFLLFFSAAAAADLPKPVAQALRAAGIPQSSVGAVVQEVGAPRPWLAVNARESLNPASVMKLVTTYAALEARAIAGYVLDRNGKRHTVVMIVNHPRAPEADAAIDALLAWVYASRLQSQLAP